MILSGRLCNFYTLSLNNYASLSADVFSVVGIKCTIFVNLSTTTKIKSYPWAKGSLVIKSTNIYIQGFSEIELGINLLAGCSVIFILLAGIVSLYILLHFFYNFWLPKISSDQFHCFLLPLMPFYQHVMMQPNYLCSKLVISWYIDFSFFVHYTINFSPLLVS